MNHKSNLIRILTLILAMLILTGCATSQSTPCPSAEPQSCPSAVPQSCPSAEPQSCPTASALIQPSMNAWRIGYNNDFLNARITFEPGDNCVLEQLKTATDSELVYEVVVNDQKYQNYMVVAQTLAEGKTLKDLQDFTQKNPENTIPPSFINMEAAQIVSPMSRTFVYAHLPAGSIYFTCIIQGPDKQRAIENLGPVEVKE